MNNETEQIFLLSAGPSQASTSSQKMGTLALPPSSQVNLEDVKDFSHVCRTCATITEFVMPIFVGEGLQNNLADKIKKHLPIQVCEDDQLPLVVCYQCASTLLAWHELVQCCMEADAALRTKLSSSQQKTISSNANIKSSSSLTGESQSKVFYTRLTSALIDFHKDLEEDHLDVEFVCQKCAEKPALITVHSLAEHIQQAHSPDLLHSSVKTFITNYITFEQVLAEDSDRETQSYTKEKSQIVLPSLHCPFCASVFSSATRLVYHLNKHVEVSVAGGVMCCHHVYSDKKHFVQHLQEAHVSKAGGEPARAECVSCGFTAHSADQLRQHYRDAHNDVKRAKEKKVESPNNQKNIPAVCPECNKTFSNKYNMFAHMRSHSHTPVYPCDKCARTYRHRGNLNHHKKMAHQGILNFICVECGEAFPSRSERDVHARVHSGETPYTCPHCGKAYRAKSTLTRHLEIHLDIRKYECEICSKKFRKKSHLDYHIKTHMKFTPIPMYGPAQPQHYRACTYCVSSHPVAAYEEHLVTAHSDLLFHCEECDEYVDRKDFIIHMSLHALQYTTQDIRRKKIKKKKEEVGDKEEVVDKEEVGHKEPVGDEEQVVNKEEVDHNPSPVPLENRPVITKTNDIKPAVVKTKTSDLDNEFSDHSDMEGFGPLPESVFEAIEDSQDSQHVEYDTSHAAPENERCSDESNRSPQHNNNNNVNNPAVCLLNNKLNNCSVVIEPININDCSLMNIATKNDKINNNLALPANNPARNTTDSDATDKEAEQSHKKKRTCPFCAKQYTASSSYYYHLKYFHKRSKEHACEVCAKKFGTRSSLTQHMAVHTGHLEFECSQCHKQFKSKASLYIHEQTHNGKKSWSCSQCRTSFRWKTHLVRHVKRHTAEKTNICNTCGRGFSVRCDLLRHARTHTAGSLTCDTCGQKFAQLRYLKVHAAKQHSSTLGTRKVS